MSEYEFLVGQAPEARNYLVLGFREPLAPEDLFTATFAIAASDVAYYGADPGNRLAASDIKHIVHDQQIVSDGTGEVWVQAPWPLSIKNAEKIKNSLCLKLKQTDSKLHVLSPKLVVIHDQETSLFENFLAA